MERTTGGDGVIPLGWANPTRMGQSDRTVLQLIADGSGGEGDQEVRWQARIHYLALVAEHLGAASFDDWRLGIHGPSSRRVARALDELDLMGLTTPARSSAVRQEFEVERVALPEALGPWLLRDSETLCIAASLIYCARVLDRLRSSPSAIEAVMQWSGQRWTRDELKRVAAHL